MKVTIYDRLAGDRVRGVVPPSYRILLPPAVEHGGEQSVLLFAHTERDVVPSSAVRRALRRLGDAAPAGIVAIGTVFTAEALDMLEERGAVVIAQKKEKWTDESAHERQL